MTPVMHACSSCDWTGYQTSVYRNIGMNYTAKDGRNLPSCPRCFCAAVPLPPGSEAEKEAMRCLTKF